MMNYDLLKVSCWIWVMKIGVACLSRGDTLTLNTNEDMAVVNAGHVFCLYMTFFIFTSCLMQYLSDPPGQCSVTGVTAKQNFYTYVHNFIVLLMNSKTVRVSNCQKGPRQTLCILPVFFQTRYTISQGLVWFNHSHHFLCHAFCWRPTRIFTGSSFRN